MSPVRVGVVADGTNGVHTPRIVRGAPTSRAGPVSAGIAILCEFHSVRLIFIKFVWCFIWVELLF